MNPSGTLEAMPGIDKQLQKKFEEDAFCRSVIELLTTEPLHTVSYRELKKQKSEALEETERQFFITNSTMPKLHKYFTNERVCKLFLLLDRGLNTTELAVRLKQNNKDKQVRTAVREWTRKLIELKLVKKSSLSIAPEVIYEKEELGNVIQLLNHISLLNLLKRKRVDIEKIRQELM